MAAVLKKRAIAELTQTIQEDVKAPQPEKKLRLVLRSSQCHEPCFDLHLATTSHQAINCLLKLEERFPIQADHVDGCIQAILDHYNKTSDTAVRVKLISVVAELSKTPGYSGSNLLLQDLRSMLSSEKSHKVIATLILALQVIGCSVPSDKKLHAQLIEIATAHLSNSDHAVRVKCLELLGSLGYPGYLSENPNILLSSTSTAQASNGATQSTLDSHIKHYSQDNDPRVRTSAFQSLLAWHERGLRLPQSTYSSLISALTDDFEGVRVAALKLVWVLAQIYPDALVPVPDSEEGSIRLVDDGFAHICHLVSDGSMRVRTTAASLLGSLHQVSKHFLEQTLDKKLMSDMRLKKSAHERNREQYERGEWSTGKKWADDKPSGAAMPGSEVSVISSGACGAFVHGLEDEYLEVRTAAIDSLCELAAKCASFANKSQDYLTDMFNDEIEAVRLNAINSVRKISHHITLREDQLDLVLSVLKDFNPEIRVALRDMFCSTTFGSKASLHECVIALLDNLKRYPSDKSSVWKCACALGKNHPSLTLPLVTQLLSAHPYFDSPEPDVDDPAYIVVLLVVFNAAVDSPTMPPLFPEHILRHYAYLRASLPDLVPALNIPGQAHTMLQSPEHGPTCQSRTLMDLVVSKLHGISQLQTAHAQKLMEFCIRDLARVAEVDLSLAGNAECLALYVRCQLGLSKRLASTEGTLDCPSLINQLAQHCHRILYSFSGLSLREYAIVRQLLLRIQAVLLLERLRAGATDSKMCCAQFLMTVTGLERYIKKAEISPDAFTNAILAAQPQLEACQPPAFLSLLPLTLRAHTPPPLTLHAQVHQATAVITKPDAINNDNVQSMTAGLTSAIRLEARLEHVYHVDRVRVEVRYPDERVSWIAPRISDIRRQSTSYHHLTTDVLLTAKTWSEAASVSISLVLVFDSDTDIASQETDAMMARLEANEMNIIELCKPVKVQVLPKPIKH